MIDGTHVSSVLDVRTCKGPHIDSDHYLVVAKFRLRISALRTARSSALRKLDVKKLHSQRTAEAFSAQLSDKLVPYLMSARVVGCWETFPTPCVLLRKLSLFPSDHPYEIYGTIKSVAKVVYKHKRKHCSQPLHKLHKRTIERRRDERLLFRCNKREHDLLLCF